MSGDEEKTEKLIQVRFSKPVLDRIEHIQNISGDISLKQLLMNALATYETLKESQLEGSKVVVESKGGKRERVIVP